MKNHELARALEKCDRIDPWFRDETLRRRQWAIDSYIEGWITAEREDEEVARFEKTAKELLSEQVLIEFLSRRHPPLTKAEEERRTQWLKLEAQRAVQVETQRQRKRLREGHQTLTAIRKLLAHAARSYPETA